MDLLEKLSKNKNRVVKKNCIFEFSLTAFYMKNKDLPPQIGKKI